MLGDLETEIDTITGSTPSNSLPITIPAGMPQINQQGMVTGHNRAWALPDRSRSRRSPRLLNEVTFVGDVQIQATPSGVGLSVDAHAGPWDRWTSPRAVCWTSAAAGIVAAVSLAGTFNFQGIATIYAAASFELNTTGSAATVQEYTFDQNTGKHQALQPKRTRSQLTIWR